jgi:4-aminobutyrate aminotransferase-like enzyme/Ser/Thr protein kinase RdoA (MazF antagonist)
VSALADGNLGWAPRLTSDEARVIAREVFGVDGVATPLPSERDQNWRITPADGDARVLKIANGAEERRLIEAQQQAMAAARSSPTGRLSTLVPEVVAADRGEHIVEITTRGGSVHLAWMISWLDGRIMNKVRYRSPAVYRDLGETTAALRDALHGFDHPAVHRDFYWDLANARRIVDELGGLVGDAATRAAIETIIARFDGRTAPLLPALERGVVHGDLNDHNILLGTDGDIASRGQRVSGIVDFGDIVHSYAVADLAILIAYVMADSEDPLVDATDAVRGYSLHRALTEPELAALFGLSVIRLCASASIAAAQTAARPGDPYLAVTQSSIARSLPALAAIPFALAEAMFRDASRLEPAPSGARVSHWIAEQWSDSAPVLGIDLETESTIVLDWSIASPMLGADERENAEPIVTDGVFSAMRDANVRVAVGRYDEPRLLYVSNAFATGGRITEERRTVHIGLDLFAEAGTPVFAPMPGRVHAFADNDAPCDYGPVIILAHDMDDGGEFYTLYGHLSRESLIGLEVGQEIRGGDQIASLGGPDVNGGWTPHLHLQIITDLLELGTDFPGVARPAYRRAFLGFSPDPNLIVRVPADRFPPTEPPKERTLAARRRALGPNLSIAYDDPVKIVRGWRQYLFDDEGHRFVDAYNNVPHVGHCHPRVVRAGAGQMSVLSTNTRYLNDVVNHYAERLAATLPEPLRVCYLVNSASEANELALRLARAHTNARDTIVLESAYHGNTTTLVDISPYKHAGPGGEGAPGWVQMAPIADDYRGKFKRDDPSAGKKYAAEVGTAIERVESRGRTLAAFIAETCPSVGGQIVFPDGYLSEVYQLVREAGGVCIADEVQTGLGRMGTHFWAFEAQHVVPDIVVMGKPLGNGHPIGAVVTTRAIAASFDTGMEYFSTFGGNTVSCAIGLAVLDVMRDEALQAHALRVGDRMLRAFRSLADQHALIGDVRGSGLFLGVELVRDRETLEPAGEEASFVVNRMRERGILLGTEGPFHNVLKIRPPMPFDESDADLLVAELVRALEMISGG